MQETSRKTESRRNSASGKDGTALWLRALQLFFWSVGQKIQTIVAAVWNKLRQAKAALEPVRLARKLHSAHSAGQVEERGAERVTERSAERRFPESNLPLVQLLLLFTTLFPRLLSLLRVLWWPVHKRTMLVFGKLRERAEHFWLSPAYFAMAAGLLAVLAIVFSRYSVVSSVSYQGRTLGLVKNTEIVDTACREIQETVSRVTGQQDLLQREDFVVTRGLTNVQDYSYLDVDSLEDVVYKDLNVVTYGYTLQVDGEVIGSTIYEGALEDLLAQIKSSHITANTISCDFVEKVEIIPGMVPTTQIVNLGTILEIINSTKEGEVTHIVQSGEVWSAIARDNGMTNAQLLNLNPGYDIDHLKIGDELTISNAVPYLTIVQVERESYEDSIPYEVEYQDDPNMYQGDYKVLSPGVAGTADVVADVTYVNGEESERIIISSVTLTEPVTEIQARGTKPRPTWLPTGSFRWPCSGKVTSSFGSRYIFGSYSYHNGLDIACPKGTAIYASDGGTVIFSGYSGTYGYLVKIDHGNGYVTYYAHNSSLLVSKGDKVYKGQQIAKAGNSGRATGYHCHFGITYNGSFINPRKKLP